MGNYKIKQVSGIRTTASRFIAEKALGKPLPEGAVVHHVNRDPSDNRNCNLVICQDSVYHKLLHRRQRAYDAGYDPTWLSCNICKEFDAPENLKICGYTVRHARCAQSRYHVLKLLK